MYRIRRESGEEVSLGSIDEFGAAVAAGIVTAKAEIFHARAEKWLPIASHPHFKMASDRVNAAAAPKVPARSPAVTASGQRPAIGASGQRPNAAAAGQRPAAAVPPSGAASTTSSTPTATSAPTPRAQAPQLRVMRTEAAAAAAPAPADSAVTQKPAPRWNSAQRTAARAVAPKPSTPQATPPGDLRLVRADALVSSAATAPALPDLDFELLQSLEAPATELAPPGPAAEPLVVHASEPVEALVERAPVAVELVSQQERRSSPRSEVEIINPDRTMPVVSEREVSLLEIPAPIHDFTPAQMTIEPAARSRSRTPLFVGLGLVAAAAVVIGFFVFKPSSAAPTAGSATSGPAARQAPVPASGQPAAPGAPVAVSAPTGASTGLGGDIQRNSKKPSSDSDTKATIDDGLEPPPAPVLPAAPKLGRMTDAAALPTVESGAATLKMLDRANALERQRRLIDSSMRQ